MSEPMTSKPEDFDWQAARLALVQQMHENRLSAVESIRSYGQNAVKGMFILNGGAAIALLTLVGSLVGRADTTSSALVGSLLNSVTWALIWFACGMACSVATSAVAYFNYHYWADYYWEPREAFNWATGGKIERDLNRPLPRIRRSARIGVALIALSAVAFAAGGWTVRAAFDDLATGLARTASMNVPTGNKTP